MYWVGGFRSWGSREHRPGGSSSQGGLDKQWPGAEQVCSTGTPPGSPSRADTALHYWGPCLQEQNKMKEHCCLFRENGKNFKPSLLCSQKRNDFSIFPSVKFKRVMDCWHEIAVELLTVYINVLFHLTNKYRFSERQIQNSANEEFKQRNWNYCLQSSQGDQLSK